MADRLRKSRPLTRQEIKKVRPVMESSRKTAKKDTSGYEGLVITGIITILARIRTVFA